MPHEKYQQCIDECNACAIECSHCATACLKEEHIIKLTRCIQLNHDCADICQLAAKLMARGSEFSERICRVCAEICQACGEECQQHTDMDHCQKCADACFRCAEVCREMSMTEA